MLDYAAIVPSDEQVVREVIAVLTRMVSYKYLPFHGNIIPSREVVHSVVVCMQPYVCEVGLRRLSCAEWDFVHQARLKPSELVTEGDRRNLPLCHAKHERTQIQERTRFASTKGVVWTLFVTLEVWSAFQRFLYNLPRLDGSFHLSPYWPSSLLSRRFHSGNSPWPALEAQSTSLQ